MNQPSTDLALAAVQAASFVQVPAPINVRGDEPTSPVRMPPTWPLDHPPSSNLVEIGGGRGGVAQPGDPDGGRSDSPEGARRLYAVGMAAQMPRAAPPQFTPSTDDSGNSWGRADTVLATDGPHEQCRISLAVSEMTTLTITTTQAPGLGELPGTIAPIKIPLYVWANVTIGGGSTSVSRRVRCDDYLSIPLTVAYLSVQVYIGNATGAPVANIPFENAPQAQVAVQVSRGVRGLPGQPTIFTHVVGVNAGLGMASSMPVRLASLSAHLTGSSGGAQLLLQLFDLSSGPVPNGTPCDAEYALGTEPDESDIGDTLRFLNPRGWGQGIQVAVSTTSGTLTEAATSAWVEGELVQV